MRRFFVLFFAAATGYVSLTQEMLWMRAVSYITGGEPATFAHVLGFFLVGVAAGALFGERVCERWFATGADGATPSRRSPVRFIAVMLLISAAFYYLAVAGVARLMTVSESLGMLAVNAAVIGVSFLLGGVFPVLCHYAARAGEAVGVTVSRVYVANIVGSTLGPLLTGFVLMQVLPTDRIILYVSLATAALGGAAFLFDALLRRPPHDAADAPLANATVAPGRRPFGATAGVVASLVLVAALIVLHRPLYAAFLERLQFKHEFAADAAHTKYKLLVQNRSGIISVSSDPTGGPDMIWGGGVYDGRFNTDPRLNPYNGILRAYMMAALHPDPKDVLVVGIASGSWTRVAADHAGVKRMVCVEINPGYIDVFRDHPNEYPEQHALLHDPKVEIVIDDGRRWMNRNPDQKFDFMLQNTTWHWRSHATNLLSKEYLELCKSRLKPGGVVYYNATWSEDAPYTAAHVFKYVTKYGNFVAASDSPFDMTPEQVYASLLKFRRNGKPTFDPDDPKLNDMLNELSWTKFENLAPEYLAKKHLWLITDDNMAPEFKRGRKSREDMGADVDRAAWLDRGRSWAAFFGRMRG